MPTTKTPSRRPNAANKKKVLIVDDHPILREGLAEVINQQPDLMVSNEAESAPTALAAIATDMPDVALVDISLDGRSGLELIKDLKALHPKLPALVLSMHDESLYAERAIRAGARGYVMKREGTKKLLAAIREVLNGQYYVSEKIATRILDLLTHRRTGTPVSSIDNFSDRELEVFQMIGQGLSTHEVARKLNLSVKTIASHQENLKRKLNLQSSRELFRNAVLWAEEQRPTEPKPRC